MKRPLDVKRLRSIFTAIEFMARKKGALDILDVGCGEGPVALELAKLGHNVLGIDINPDRIQLASQSNKNSNASFMLLEAEKIDQLQRKFDVIICSEVLEHVDNPETVINQLAKAIRRGGVLFLTVPNGLGPYEVFSETPQRLSRKLFVRIGLQKKQRQGQAHKTNFTIGRLKRLLGKKGFQILFIQNSDFIMFLPFLRDTFLATLDCRLADNLPHFMSSGWYFACSKQLKHPQKPIDQLKVPQ